MGLPDAGGHFGQYGGRFVPEALVAALDELDDAFRKAWVDDAFHAELDGLLHDYSGPSHAADLRRAASRAFGVAQVLLKREDLNHTGSHKINNVLGQALLTKRMGKTRVIAETGPASTAWPPPRRRRCSASSVWCTWARRTRSARRSTSPGCSCSARRWSR